MALAIFLLFLSSVSAQTIYDIWQTTWDRNKLFTRLQNTAIKFGQPGPIGVADIVVDDSVVYQQMDGFGAALSDSSAKVLNELKYSNNGRYWALLNQLFNTAEGYDGAGITVLRLPLGASDFSDSEYSFAESWNDWSLSSFNLNNAPSYLWSVLADIKYVGPTIKIFAVPWSAPAWMKTSGTMKGGSLISGYEATFAYYLFKCVQGMAGLGFLPYTISPQNEPQHSGDSYPTMLLSVSQEAAVGVALRKLLDDNGFSCVKIIGYDHNWNNAAMYPVELMKQAGYVFTGVAFHCYEGVVSQQLDFHNSYPNKEVYFTECTGTLGADWWANVKWNMDNLFVSSTQNYARTVMFWNLALHSDGSPKLPGTGSCNPGCRPVVNVDVGGYSLNQEYYLIAHSQRAVVPRDPGGPHGKRIKVTLGGNLSWTLRVQAYATGRVSSTEWPRYTIVVLNWYDFPNGQWNPTPVSATIEFRGVQAQYTFPVGLTTLWWYATPRSLNSTDSRFNATECSSDTKDTYGFYTQPS